MEPLLRQLRELPARFAALSARVRYLMLGGLGVLVVGILIATFASESGAYQYAFTNLTTEDSSEAGGVLKAANVPYRLEAGGSALAVPASKVHEARLLLAAAGLPRGGGVGFEIFDRGDLGISEFTQKVNLRRAIEGELARTIGRLSPVRSARVHITLPEKGLYRNEERKAAAAVVLNLQPGRTVDARELQGVRHLVSAAVAGLPPEAVTVVDGRGTVLAGDKSEGAKLVSEQREMETGLEQRIIDLLEPVVGRGAVVAKVTASLDSREVESTQDVYDPEAAAVRSERKVVEQINADQNGGGAIAGAAANQPLNPAGGASSGGSRNQTNREDTLKNYEITKTVTRSVSRAPRLLRLSAAVLVSGTDGKPRAEAELRRLGELAKHAVGFDERRGDRFDISSQAFANDLGDSQAQLAIWERPGFWKVGVGALLAALLLVGGLGVLLLRRRRSGTAAAEVALLRPGSNVAELEAAFSKAAALPAKPARPELPAKAPGELAAAEAEGAEVDQIGPDGAIPGSEGARRKPKQPVDIVLRARELTEADPQRAAHLLRAWILIDLEKDKDQKGEREQKSA